MVKYLVSFALTLVLIVSCTKKENEKKFQEIKVTKKSVIGVFPDSTEIKKMKDELGEEDFYVMADDVLWYNGQMLEVLDSLKIDYIYTNSKFLKIKTPEQTYKVNNDTSQIKWRYFYYDGKHVVEKDLFDLINLQKPLK